MDVNKESGSGVICNLVAVFLIAGLNGRGLHVKCSFLLNSIDACLLFLRISEKLDKAGGLPNLLRGRAPTLPGEVVKPRQRFSIIKQKMDTICHEL